MPSLSGLLHDAASLHRFVAFVCQFCEEQETSHTYLEATTDFFAYVRQLGTETLTYLQRLVDHAGRSKRIREYRQKLVAIKNCWCELHAFVKPAADAHTLKIPVPLLQFLQTRLRQLPTLSKARIVILLSPELNYFQHRHGDIRDLTTKLHQLFATQRLPEALGFIAIPYSQAATIFTNIFICHELGHFAFEELARGTQLSPDIDLALKKVLKDFDTASEAKRSWCRRQLIDWAEEIYCDLFALRLLGPAYSFASIELFSLLGLLDDEGSCEFNSSHPADACRFREHLLELKSQGWWAVVKKFDTEHVQLIQHLGGMSESKYVFPLAPGLVRAFLPLRKRIQDLVGETIVSTGSDLREFRNWNRKIQEYLSCGVVPSTLAVKRRFYFPPPVAVMNAAFGFYLESLWRLIANTEDPDYVARDVGERGKLSGRIELWTIKALEDYRLLQGEAKSV